MARIVPMALIALALLACTKREAVKTDATDTRAAIQIAYVGSPEMKVHARSDDASPVVTTFLNGESVSILSKKGDWIEVRIANGSGWAHLSDLTTAEAARAEEQNPSPKFRVAPSPVSSPGASGTVYIEAAVNTDGDVTSTKLISNTTGSAELAGKNEQAIRNAKFYPIVLKGRKREFLYYYRVDY